MKHNTLTTERLIDYAAGDLNPAEALQVEERLTELAPARETVALYQSIQCDTLGTLFESAPARCIEAARSLGQRTSRQPFASMLEHLDEVVAKLFFDSRLAVAGMRSSANDNFHVAYHGGSIDIEIDAEPRAQTGSRGWRLTGQISTTREQNRAMINLVTNDRPFTQVISDQFGVFSVEVDAGTYDMRFALADDDVVIRGLRVG